MAFWCWLLWDTCIWIRRHWIHPKRMSLKIMKEWLIEWRLHVDHLLLLLKYVLHKNLRSLILQCRYGHLDLAFIVCSTLGLTQYSAAGQLSPNVSIHIGCSWSGDMDCGSILPVPLLIYESPRGGSLNRIQILLRRAYTIQSQSVLIFRCAPFLPR